MIPGFDEYVETKVVAMYEDDLRDYLRRHGLGKNTNFARWAREAIFQANRRGINTQGLDVVLGIALMRACERSYTFADKQVPLIDSESEQQRARMTQSDIHQIALWLTKRFRYGLLWWSRSRHSVEEYEQLLNDLNTKWTTSSETSSVLI